MKNRYSVLSATFCLTLASVTGQTTLTEQEYQDLKGHGMLPPGPITITTGDAPSGGPSEWVLNRGGSPCGCWIAPDNDYLVAMVPNDDGSTAVITLPFTFSMFGEPYTEVFVNNNGNVSFGNSYGTYTANGFPSADFVMVAPFWADVDTRGEDGNGLNGGEVVYKVTDHALYVNWVDVGYYNSQTDKHNSFQLIITDGTDLVVPGGNNVSFCYQDMQWTTGAASGGIEGFGGTSATVGANRGNEIDHAQVGLFNHDDDIYNGAYTDSSGVHWLDSTHFYMNTSGAGVPPIFGSTFDCDTVVVQMPEQELEVRDGGLYRLIVLPGAPDELVSCTSVAPTLPNFVNIDAGPEPYLELFFPIDAEEAEIGLHFITFTATNNDDEPLSSTYVLQVEKTGQTNGLSAHQLEGFQLTPGAASESSLLTWPSTTSVQLVELVAADGRTLASLRPVAAATSILLDLRGLPAGGYLVRALAPAGVWTGRLVHSQR